MNNREDLIQVLLAVKNGEAFLAEQLESLKKQTHVRIELLVGIADSNDSSLKILADYREEFEKCRIIQTNTGSVSGDFLMLIKNANSNLPTAFCDQDDIWFSTKLYESVAELQNISGPGLVTVGWHQVDSNGTPSGQNFMPGNFVQLNSLLFQNRILGCSILMNSLAFNELKGISEKESSYIIAHDWWAMLMISILGEIRALNKTLLGYRIHSTNNVGIPKVFSNRWFKNRLNRKWTLEVRQQLVAIERSVLNRGNPRDILQLQDAINFLRGKPKSTLKILFSRKSFRENLIDDLFLRLAGLCRMLTNLFRKPPLHED